MSCNVISMQLYHLQRVYVKKYLGHITSRNLLLLCILCYKVYFQNSQSCCLNTGVIYSLKLNKMRPVIYMNGMGQRNEENYPFPPSCFCSLCSSIMNLPAFELVSRQVQCFAVTTMSHLQYPETCSQGAAGYNSSDPNSHQIHRNPAVKQLCGSNDKFTQQSVELVCRRTSYLPKLC